MKCHVVRDEGKIQRIRVAEAKLRAGHEIQRHYYRTGLPGTPRYRVVTHQTRYPCTCEREWFADKPTTLGRASTRPGGAARMNSNVGSQLRANKANTSNPAAKPAARRSQPGPAFTHCATMPSPARMGGHVGRCRANR